MDPRFTYICTLCVYIRTSRCIGMKKKIKNIISFLPSEKKIGSAGDSKQEFFYALQTFFLTIHNWLVWIGPKLAKTSNLTLKIKLWRRFWNFTKIDLTHRGQRSIFLPNLTKKSVFALSFKSSMSDLDQNWYKQGTWP